MGGPRRVALEDKIGRIFIEFRSTKAVLAMRRRELIAQHGRGKVHTRRLVASLKEKRNADGAVTKKRAKTTTGDLVSDGNTPGTSSAKLAGETSR